MTQPTRFDFQSEKELPEPVKFGFANLRRSELKFSYDQVAKLHQENNAIMREVTAELTVPLIDLEPSMKKPEHFYDTVHMTETGSKEAAHIISDKLHEVLASGQ